MTDLAALKKINLDRWNRMKIEPHAEFMFAHVAWKLSLGKSRYETVSGQTFVPWEFIAVVHEREASQSWAGALAQGDPWNKISIHVPRGRGPFTSWEDAAVD